MKPEINVTPLIDVLLVLIIIFMVISPINPSQFKTHIPSEPVDEDEPAKPNPDTLIVKINSDYSLELNKIKDLGTIPEPALLQNKLTSVFSERLENGVFNQSLSRGQNLPLEEQIQKTVFIQAPRSIPYGQVVKVIDAVKTVGAQPISLQIDDLE